MKMTASHYAECAIKGVLWAFIAFGVLLAMGLIP